MADDEPSESVQKDKTPAASPTRSPVVVDPALSNEDSMLSAYPPRNVGPHMQHDSSILMSGMTPPSIYQQQQQYPGMSRNIPATTYHQQSNARGNGEEEDEDEGARHRAPPPLTFSSLGAYSHVAVDHAAGQHDPRLVASSSSASYMNGNPTLPQTLDDSSLPKGTALPATTNNQSNTNNKRKRAAVGSSSTEAPYPAKRAKARPSYITATTSSHLTVPVIAGATKAAALEAMTPSEAAQLQAMMLAQAAASRGNPTPSTSSVPSTSHSSGPHRILQPLEEDADAEAEADISLPSDQEVETALGVSSPSSSSAAAPILDSSLTASSSSHPVGQHATPSPKGSPTAFIPSGSPNPDGTITAQGMRLPPIMQVEKQHVTTSATQAASASRRRNEAVFECPVPGCGSTFTRRFNLRGHLRSHTEERPFKCDWPGCDKSFARKHDCNRHTTLHSSMAAQHQCSGCGKSFSRTDALNRHLRSEGGAACKRASAAQNRAALQAQLASQAEAQAQAQAQQQSQSQQQQAQIQQQQQQHEQQSQQQQQLASMAQQAQMAMYSYDPQARAPQQQQQQVVYQHPQQHPQGANANRGMVMGPP